MRCAKVTQQLSALLDGELKPSEAEQIREHLKSCPECRKELQALELTIQSVKALPTMKAPADLANRVLAGIEEIEAQPEQPANVLRAQFKMRMLWPAAAALFVGVGIALLSPAMRGGHARKLYDTDTKQEVAVRRTIPFADQLRAPASEEPDDSYAFWMEDENAQKGGLSAEDSIRTHEVADDETMLELGFSLKQPPAVAEKDIVPQNELALRPLDGTLFDKTDQLDAPAFGMRTQDEPVETRGRARGLTADAIASLRMEEIEIRSEDPQAAYAKVATIAARFAQPDKSIAQAAVAERTSQIASAPQKLLLNLTDSQLAQVKKEIVVAGLTPTSPEKIKRDMDTLVTAEALNKAGIDLLEALSEKELAGVGGGLAGKPVEGKKSLTTPSSGPAISDIEPESGARIKKAEITRHLEESKMNAEMPGRVSGDFDGESLIRVSISFIKTDTSAAITTESMPADIKPKKE